MASSPLRSFLGVFSQFRKYSEKISAGRPFTKCQSRNVVNRDLKEVIYLRWNKCLFWKTSDSVVKLMVSITSDVSLR